MQAVQSFDEFRELTYRHAFAFAMRLTRNRDDAEDLLQDSYLRAFRAFGHRTDDQHPQAWLNRIVHNRFLDSLRDQRRRPATLSLQSLQEACPLFDKPDSRPDPEQRLMADVFSEPVHAGLDRLSEDHRNLLLDIVFRQEGNGKLAARLGCQTATLKTRIHRATRAFRRHLLPSAPGYSRTAGVL